MVFRPAQHRALTSVEDAVCGSDERLAALFALFSRLYAGEQMPTWERIRVRRPRLLGAVLAPLLIALGRLAVALLQAAGWLAARSCHAAGTACRRIQLAMAGASEPRPRRLTPGPSGQ